jgi:UDPglucose 6-dehydrogenase
VAANIGQPHDLALATEATNTYQISRLAQQVAALLYGLPDGVPHTVGVLGLAYKPETDVVEESAGIDLVEVLDDAGIDVLALDPWANEAASLCVSSAVRLTESLEECVSNSAVVVITTPWSEFHDIKLSWLERDDYRPAVIDCWGMFGPRVFDAVADYHATGKGD